MEFFSWGTERVDVGTSARVGCGIAFIECTQQTDPSLCALDRVGDSFFSEARWHEESSLFRSGGPEVGDENAQWQGEFAAASITEHFVAHTMVQRMMSVNGPSRTTSPTTSSSLSSQVTSPSVSLRQTPLLSTCLRASLLRRCQL